MSKVHSKTRGNIIATAVKGTCRNWGGLGLQVRKPYERIINGGTQGIHLKNQGTKEPRKRSGWIGNWKFD